MLFYLQSAEKQALSYCSWHTHIRTLHSICSPAGLPRAGGGVWMATVQPIRVVVRQGVQEAELIGAEGS